MIYSAFKGTILFPLLGTLFSEFRPQAANPEATQDRLMNKTARSDTVGSGGECRECESSFLVYSGQQFLSLAYIFCAGI